MRTPATSGLVVSAALAAALVCPAADHDPRPDEAADRYNWENLDVLSVNRQPAHAWMVPFASASAALTGGLDSSERVVSLDESWRFSWVRRPADRPWSAASRAHAGFVRRTART